MENISLKEFFDEINALIREHRPDLIDEYPSGDQPLSSLSAFLNRNFPNGHDWGAIPLRKVLKTLRSTLKA